jgi:hypothetical protein
MCKCPLILSVFIVWIVPASVCPGQLAWRDMLCYAMLCHAVQAELRCQHAAWGYAGFQLSGSPDSMHMQ